MTARTQWKESYSAHSDYWERTELSLCSETETETFRNNRGYLKKTTRTFEVTGEARNLVKESTVIDDGLGTKREEIKDLVNLVVATKIDQVAEGKIVWMERAPTFSSKIEHSYKTIGVETVCNETVEKQGFDSEGSWKERWGK